ncbi:MAG TPA: phosphopantetheine-binding protein [Longimicrobium sp.]|jgi:acyl carrier protein|uniref:phosphopantetheine-binding protein n=1 Tax=Longimicrobium sp. TaxID=2029185 RepID=UPI002ED9D7AE
MEDGFVAPRTPLEESLCAFWSEVLKKPRVGIRDRFDELGGNSLLAIRIAARLVQSTGIEVPVRSLFDHPTVEELAAHVEELRWAGTAVAASIEEAGGEDREEGSL